jgi:hypothetical protein
MTACTGIVHHDGQPLRDCFAFNATAAELARVTLDASGGVQEQQQKQEEEGEKEACAQGGKGEGGSMALIALMASVAEIRVLGDMHYINDVGGKGEGRA